MSVEKKFRAWLPEQQLMSYSGSSQFMTCPDGKYEKRYFHIESMDDSFTAINTRMTTNFIPMQITGMYDIDQKTIWEGDIVEIVWFTEDEMQRHVSEVFYNADGFCTLWGGTAESLSEHILNTRVIGNIHQHPELLNQ